MKTVFVIIFSLLLAGFPFLPAQMPASCARQARACCPQGKMMPCCAAKSDSQPKPAAPAPNRAQDQLSLLAPLVLTSTLSVTPASSNLPSWTPVSTPSATPLFARHCALLL